MRNEAASLLVPGIALVAALMFFGIPYFLTRETAAREPEAATVRATPGAEAAKTPKKTISTLGGKLVFSDVATQSREFMGYYNTIELTTEQEAIKAEVLEAMPAACCSGSSAYTCCCPCNLSKTLWGLSNYVIATKGANATQLKEVVDAWIGFTNPDGYSGNACYSGGCGRAFDHNGCGGMSESELVL